MYIHIYICTREKDRDLFSHLVRLALGSMRLQLGLAQEGLLKGAQNDDLP